MAARKLQTEIDKTLKKVAEGVEAFEEQYQKIQQTTNHAHKEKIVEVELKTQIKKLQRLRDQIKTWLASNDIKDKKALTENRKLIETQMERFKACEKEMKTKAFSKEGLSAGHRLDPREQLKQETVAFISNHVDELSRQVESTEAEIEQLQGGAKKGKKGAAGNAERVSILEEQNDRRNWHISRLELINRLMENGNLDPDRVQGLKEDISYYVESNTEEDFEEDEGLYDELNLEDEEEAFGIANDDIQSSHDSTSLADTSDIGSHVPVHTQVRTPAKKESKPTASAKEKDEADEKPHSPTAVKTKSTGTANRKPTLDGTAQRPTGLVPPTTRTTSSSTPSTAATSTTAAKEPAPSGPAPRTVPTVLPPIRYSAAAASAVHASPQAATTPSATSAAPQTQVTSPTSTTAPQILSPTSNTPQSTTQPAASLKAPAASPEPPQPAAPATASSEASPSPAPSQASGAPSAAPSQIQNTLSPSLAHQDATRILSPSQEAASMAPLQALEVGSQSQQQLPASPDDKSGIPMSDDAAPAQSSPKSSAQNVQHGAVGQPANSTEPRLPSSLADLVTSFESAKQKSLRRDNDLSAINNILEAGYSNIPQPADAEKPKYYIPRNPYPTPHYYPQQPSPHLANPTLFAKFDVDTLFYIFYYCQGTYMQYLAAQELKKQSWRFHKQYLTWFQRANEPQTITDEYEQGVYLYFDFEGSWAQRRKENFSFFYRHLEE
ncbi:hypothetical protein P389DRAFT_195881 [Cystobasidium minutum MCA 4210]|uniref:uncharacterized protein n=1 Tax=Cystobasidium minutum MCA 4210 TaxID=1397322 RepID=UPI0034CE6513|eukprot:jgi/Rhomi1/195881/gm1.4095_g